MRKTNFYDLKILKKWHFLKSLVNHYLFSFLLNMMTSLFSTYAGKQLCTVEPRFSEPLVNEVLDITNDILCPGQSYSKIYGIEPRYNEFFDISNIIWKPERRIYLNITNYNVNTRQKINAELINSQQIL